jgi:hypothetical protein
MKQALNRAVYQGRVFENVSCSSWRCLHAQILHGADALPTATLFKTAPIATNIKAKGGKNLRARGWAPLHMRLHLLRLQAAAAQLARPHTRSVVVQFQHHVLLVHAQRVTL